MASGNSLLRFDVRETFAFLSTDAQHGVRNEQAVIKFDGATNNIARVRGVMPQHYDGGGVDVILKMSNTGTTGDVDWDVAFERQTGQVLTSDGFAAVQSTNNTSVPGTAHTEFSVTVSFTDGSQMDSVTAGDMFRMRITRDAANDTNSSNTELRTIEIQEA